MQYLKFPLKVWNNVDITAYLVWKNIVFQIWQPKGNVMLQHHDPRPRVHVYITYIHTYIYIPAQPREHRGRPTEHPYEPRQLQWPHPAPLSGWAGWRSSSENIYTLKYKVDPWAAVFRCSVCLVAASGSQFFQVLKPRHIIPEATAPLQLLEQTSFPLPSPPLLKKRYSIWAKGMARKVYRPANCWQVTGPLLDKRRAPGQTQAGLQKV